MFDSLMIPSEDEPASSYGLVAESVDVAPDHASVVYTLRKEARFWDGSPITPEDVVWTFDTLKAKGHPRWRLYYADVLKAEKTGPHQVKFTFRNGANRELPSIVGEMPVLSKAYWSKSDFSKTTLDKPMGSGPYRIDSVDPGRSDHLSPGGGLLGQGSAGQPRAQQFQRQSATTITATRAWRSKPSRPAPTTSGSRTSRRTGPSAMTARRCRRVSSRKSRFPTRCRRACRRFGFNTRRADFRRCARAPGAGLSVRFRMDQQEPVLRRLYPHQELFLEFRSRLVGPARAGRAEDPGAIPRQDSRRGVHPGLCAAHHRRLGQHPRQSARGARAAGRRPAGT